MKGRIYFTSAILIAILVLISGRLFYVQVVKGSEYAARSKSQSRRREIVKAVRGAIRDRNGIAFAKSISRAVKLDEIGISSKKNSKSVKRIYPFDNLSAPVVGYIGTDGGGLAGVEYEFNDYLKGEDGWKIIQKDGRNRRVSRIDMRNKIPVRGSDVYLTIDVNMQKIVEDVLAKRVKDLGAKNGMCIIIDPATGDVLAMANVPSFNPNDWRDYSFSTRKNRCITYNYEPGSTFKVITAASALEEGVKSETDTIDGNMGRYIVYDQVIKDHRPYGKITFKDALSYSSNVCFAKIANELGNASFYKYIKNFGFGTESGINLPGDEAGIVHPINRWSGRTRVTMAMGQEISATLMQMVNAFGVVANGGVLLEPHIIKRIENSEGKVLYSGSSKAKRRVISKETSSRLRNMMTGVVEYGTAKKIAVEGMAIAGKTGTSQKIDPETGGYSNSLVWASFIGIVPVDKPALVCGVVIDEPALGEAGAKAAGPVFAQIMRQIVSHPQLNYAEKLLNPKEPINEIAGSSDGKLYPNISGMDINEATDFLRKEGISFSVVGNGSKVSRQTPPAGKTYSSKSEMIIYAKRDLEDEKNIKKDIRVPYCVGKDLRDAINIVNLKGLQPYVYGAGIVKKQFPVSGSLIQSTEVCTLYCSFDG